MAQREELLKNVESLRWDLGDRFHDDTVEALYAEATRISSRAVILSENARRPRFDQLLDQLLTNRWTGFPLMILVLAVVFWVTIEGANIPSAFLSGILLDGAHPILKNFGETIGMPWWLNGFLFDGIYLAMAWVVSVMLPPMAIFFPLFTLAEDFGYLPRVAFNLDSMFRKSGAHGKQALTMAMGYGCNAAAIISTRIIDSPRERLVAILTNNFAICNGRWPTQILIATIFVGALAPPSLSGLVSSLTVVAVVMIGIAMTFLVSWGLSKTILKGEASFFSLELPPYRPPRFWRTIYTSVIDRTLIVLWRAVVWALPAGAVIWLVSNIYVGELSIAENVVSFLDPLGIAMGLNGVILLAYIIAIPANEIVIPTVLMLTVLVTRMAGMGSGAGVMFELDSELATAQVLQAGGWTLLTGINLMLFSLLHNPCSTTLHTIYKETQSVKWTTLSAVIPLVIGFIVCFAVAVGWRFLG
jgi:ferrous iron transport protein B